MGTELIVAETPFVNTRRWPRYKLNVPVRTIVNKAGRTRVIEGKGKELNEGGLAVFAGVELEVDEQVEIEFTPPYSNQPVRVKAVVRNRTGYVYGVEFLMTTMEDYERVNVIREHLRVVGSPMA